MLGRSFRPSWLAPSVSTLPLSLSFESLEPGGSFPIACTCQLLPSLNSLLPPPKSRRTGGQYQSQHPLSFFSPSLFFWACLSSFCISLFVRPFETVVPFTLQHTLFRSFHSCGILCLSQHLPYLSTSYLSPAPSNLTIIALSLLAFCTFLFRRYTLPRLRPSFLLPRRHNMRSWPL